MTKSIYSATEYVFNRATEEYEPSGRVEIYLSESLLDAVYSCRYTHALHDGRCFTDGRGVYCRKHGKLIIEARQ